MAVVVMMKLLITRMTATPLRQSPFEVMLMEWRRGGGTSGNRLRAWCEVGDG
jgi:hypothetical protein